MGALTFDALLRSLKQGAPDPVYYLHGEEDVLKDEAVRVLLERAVDPVARDFNVDQRTAADLDPEAFNALVNTPPILAATRAVVLRGMEQLRKTAKVRQELLHYLDSPNPSTVLVLVHGTPEPPDAELLRRATAVEVAALPPERVERWMTHRAKQLGFTLTPEAGSCSWPASETTSQASPASSRSSRRSAPGGRPPGTRWLRSWACAAAKRSRISSTRRSSDAQRTLPGWSNPCSSRQA